MCATIHMGESLRIKLLHSLTHFYPLQFVRSIPTYSLGKAICSYELHCNDKHCRIYIMEQSTAKHTPVVLVIMDGVGVAQPSPGNAVTLASTPNLDRLWPNHPHGYLEASGVHVGLPPNVEGNSEVGHMSLGAGRVIFQDLPRIDNAIKNGSFFQNPELKGAFAHALKNGSNIHLMGVVGRGQVHASFDHLKKLLEMAKLEKANPDKVFIHVFSDGRDSPTEDAIELMHILESECLRLRLGRIVSVIGRAHAMDRDNRWEKTKKAYELLVNGVGFQTTDPDSTIKDNYKLGRSDEYIEPMSILLSRQDKPITIRDNDSVIFFNFRTDRARQLTQAFLDPNFKGFERKLLTNLYYVGMTDYVPGLMQHVAFPEIEVVNYLGQVISANKKKQLRVSESEKFPHVTYFFDCEHREPLPGEVWVEVPSPRDIESYDQKPAMSQRWVTDVAIERMSKEHFDFVLINYAGPDMVAHTGVIEATIEALDVVDECIGRVDEIVKKQKGTLIITSDHGNSEELLDIQTGEPDTKHSTNQVPLLIIQDGLTTREIPVGKLADVAPTVLGLLGLEKPADMTGRDLLDDSANKNGKFGG